MSSKRPVWNIRVLALSTALGCGMVSAIRAAEPVGPAPEQLAKVRQAGIDYLRSSQAEDGSWTVATSPGISGLCVYALLESGVAPDDPTVAKGLKHLESFIHDDGGVYYDKGNHRNYETCIALLAFQAANRGGKYDKQLAGAEKFLRGLQWDEGEGLESSDVAYGGAGYGSHSRPDLSNTQFLLEALKAAGAGPDDPAIKKALVFVSRTQNLESEHNTTPHAAKVDDGGFYYTPAAGGTSQAGNTDNGGLRSYASMTYAGLKSMIYAGLTKDDPRVAAALKWLQRHYSLDQNPGMGPQGLFYYYHTFAKTLDVLGDDYFVDDQGERHDWRKELVAKLADLQKENGSWVNAADRWYEGDPNLVTAYALMALSHCEPKADVTRP
ncbi:MAG: prenyltransferase/squalene oxidase repeat-containing protein [Planctomycetaceae bacterium]